MSRFGTLQASDLKSADPAPSPSWRSRWLLACRPSVAAHRWLPVAGADVAASRARPCRVIAGAAARHSGISDSAPADQAEDTAY